MRSKKVVFVLLVLIIFSYTNVYSLTKSELTILNLDPITTINKPTGYTSVQGGTTTKDYVITLFINESANSDGKTAILILNKNNYKKVRLEKNPIKEYDFKHANDAAYNSNTNELIVLGGRSLNFIDLNDDSFELSRTVYLDKYYHGIGYDDINDQYVLARTIENGTMIEVRNTDFELVRNFKIETNLTKQSLTVHDGNIYYVCYEAGRINKYQTIYDGILLRKENLIYVYSTKGQKKTIYYIPYSYKEVIFGEIENISFNDNKMLIQFNHANKAGYFTAEYVHEANYKTNIKVSKESKNDEYSVYLEGKEIYKTKPTNNKISLNFNYTEEGLYEYIIKPSIDKDLTEEELSDRTKTLNVEVYYDPIVNKLKTKSTSDILSISDTYLNRKPKEVKEINPQNDNITLLGMIIIILGISYIIFIIRQDT